jgi:hypothetical protein
VATGTAYVGGTANDLTAREMMSRAAATEGGWFFADRQGNFVFALAGATGANLGSYDTRPSASGGSPAGLVGLTFAHDDRTFHTVARTQVTVASKAQDVEYRHPNADVYGEVLYNPPTQFFQYDLALDAAIAAVGDATPKIDITEAEVMLGAAGVDALTVLRSDVLDHGTFTARIPGPGTPFVTDSRVVRVAHHYDGGVHAWTTKWSLIPA